MRLGLIVAAAAVVVTHAQTPASAPQVTFTKDIAPILQRSCQQCHTADGGAPMSLVTYEEVRPFARAIKQRTSMGPRAGVMPPWFVEKNIGIQHYKSDPSLSDEEIAKIAAWVDSGSPRGNPADMPPPRKFAAADAWILGTPDLIVKSPDVFVPAVAPDRWGSIGSSPSGLTEDRWVKSVEVREINDIPRGDATKTVGGRFVFHHMNYDSQVPGQPGSVAWPIHEIGRNPDVFPDAAGRLLAANSVLEFNASHIHANGHDTHAHLEFGFRFFPKGYQPLYRRSPTLVGNGNDLDVKPNTAGQEIHAYATLQEHTKIIAFEPHLHAPGTRMCLEAIWGMNIQQLTCTGYDHNWVKQYIYEDDYAPLLPKGTILHLIGFLDTTPANKNPADPRNWAGGGRRSVANMFIDLGYSVSLTEEQFQAEMAKRRERMKSRNDYDIGCPLCWAPPVATATKTTAQGQQK
ncbi:MAG TPA: cytochrome c [Vicinamibacterales bacterium]|nr:cytochrome c [Vicinamibacterales bacterium]